MFINYDSHNHLITSVELTGNNNILLFKTSLYTYKYMAIGDCYTISVFKTFEDKPFSSVVGKIIKGIKDISSYDFDYEAYKDGECEKDDECKSFHLYEMTFKNSDETFKFLLVNYSNGYINSYIVL
jgi:hypothetical protein